MNILAAITTLETSESFWLALFVGLIALVALGQSACDPFFARHAPAEKLYAPPVLPTRPAATRSLKIEDIERDLAA